MPYHLLEIVPIMMRLLVPLEFHSVKFLHNNKFKKTQVDKTQFNLQVVLLFLDSKVANSRKF